MVGAAEVWVMVRMRASEEVRARTWRGHLLDGVQRAVLLLLLKEWVVME